MGFKTVPWTLGWRSGTGADALIAAIVVQAVRDYQNYWDNPDKHFIAVDAYEFLQSDIGREMIANATKERPEVFLKLLDEWKLVRLEWHQKVPPFRVIRLTQQLNSVSSEMI